MFSESQTNGIRESRRFILRIVQLLTKSRCFDERRRGLMRLATNATLSRNIPDVHNTARGSFNLDRELDPSVLYWIGQLNENTEAQRSQRIQLAV